MPATAPLIELVGLYRDYGPLRAVAGVDLRLERGEVLGLLGPNGAGKSSTMQMLAGTLAPSAGGVRIDGVDLLEQPRQAKRRLGYLPEQPPIYPDMTVSEYLHFAAALHGVARAERDAAVQRAVARCGLTGVEPRLLGHLSKGYQQRAGIAQAIVHDPAAVVLDEPTVGLDPIQIREIRALIAELGREHGVVLSTHILPEVQAVCSRVAIMHQGHIVFSEPMATLDASAPADSFLVTLARAPALAQIEALEAVRAAEAAESRIRVWPAAESGGIERVTEQFVAAGWGLTELIPERRSLEQIFVDMTAQDAPTAEAA
ncbi:MAG: ABC transporter ATP-binding protein [Halofilum sp. (in: g-proteobacteria)]